MKRVFTVVICLCIITAFTADTDGIIDTLKNKMAVYFAERPYANLYVHLDKNNYLTNETIWFKAYLLNHFNPGNKVLFVRLTDKDKKIVLSAQFPFYDIRAHGDIALPDTLKEGDYIFYAYTNTMLNHSANQVFVQKIKVFQNAAEDMQAEASVTDSTKLHRGGAVDVLIMLKKGGSYVADAKGSYQLIVDGKPFKNARISTNFLGEAVISFTYPQLADDQTLQVKAKFNKNADYAVLNLDLRHEASPVLVNVYPEGGHLIAGVLARCMVEAGDNRNNPLAATLLFKSGGKTISTLKTNKQGMATLNFVPQAGTDYHFEVPGNTNKTPIALGYNIEQAGYTLHIYKTGDKAFASIANHGKSDSVVLVLRTHDVLLWHQQLSLKPGDSTKIELPLNYPKQVFSAALFDNKGGLIAERLFENKQNEDYHIGISTDKPAYGIRQKVKVSIDARYLAGEPVAGNLSVAVVEKSRINNDSYINILDAYYCKPLSISFPDQHYGYTNAAEMDAVLLTKQWQQYSWDNICRYKQKGFIRAINNVEGVTGIVTRRDHKPVDLKQLILYSKIKGFRSVPLNTDGSFTISPAELTGARTDNESLFLNQHFYDDYNITLDKFENEYDGMVQVADAMKFLEPYNSMVKYNDKSGINLKGAIQLHEVKINSRGMGEYQLLRLGVFRSTTCNDYVCENHVLNCPNHKKGIPPTEGAHYHYLDYIVVYHGCGDLGAANHPVLKKISLPYDFPLPDYDKEPSNEPELHSTIYWNPNINIDKSGKVSFEFYTSDIKGEFTIMVQGIAVGTLRPIMGIGAFVVK